MGDLGFFFFFFWGGGGFRLFGVLGVLGVGFRALGFGVGRLGFVSGYRGGQGVEFRGIRISCLRYARTPNHTVLRSCFVYMAALSFPSRMRHLWDASSCGQSRRSSAS